MPMKDGFRTLIVFSAIPNTNFAEVSVKPPGLVGRGPIDISSMRNNALITKWPKQLQDFSNLTSSCQWDAIFLNQLMNLVVNKNQTITVTMPDARAIQFYGWADGADPQDQREGEVPLINLTIISSNINPVGVESRPLVL